MEEVGEVDELTPRSGSKCWTMISVGKGGSPGGEGFAVIQSAMGAEDAVG